MGKKGNGKRRRARRPGEGQQPMEGEEMEEEEAAKMEEEEEADEDKRCFLCWTKSTDRCNHCNLVYFCSENHRKLHRPERLCFPFRVVHKAGVGRCMVAVRDIQPLELLLYDRTLALGPRAGCAPVCLQCLRPIVANEGEEEAEEEAGDGMVLDGHEHEQEEEEVQPESPALHFCRGCGWPLCGEDCQRGRAHSAEECAILATAKDKVSFPRSRAGLSRPHPKYRSIAPLRLLLLRDRHPEFHQRFDLLMDHNEERRRADKQLWDVYHQHVTRFLREDCGLAARFTEEEVERATGIYWTNSFGCAGGGGMAVFPTFSFASHSCVSNCAPVVFPNRHLALQSKIAIKRGDELTISYISPIQSTQRRRAKLRQKWFFECACRRCLDPTEAGSNVSSLICQFGVDAAGKGRACGGLLAATSGAAASATAAAMAAALEGGAPQQVWACRKCGAAVRAADILSLENTLARQIRALSILGDESAFRRLLREHLALLHANHYLLLLLKRHLVLLVSQRQGGFAALTLDELRDVKAMCEEVLSVLNAIDPGYSRDRGVMLRHLSEAAKCLCRRLFQDGLIAQDRFTRQVHECMLLFEESQRCMAIIVKKQ